MINEEAAASGISIHALREEGDRWSALSAARKTISIHALREEGDHFFGRLSGVVRKFLSTPSARRATLSSPSRYPAQ